MHTEGAKRTHLTLFFNGNVVVATEVSIHGVESGDVWGVTSLEWPSKLTS